MNLKDVQTFLDEFQTCVVSTIHLDQPQAAVVGFSVDDECKILIATNQNTRKASNLVENNKVALVVGFDGPRTVQLEGVARKIEAEEYTERIGLHFRKVPGAQKHVEEAGQNYYLITPTWLRFTDYTNESPIFETEDIT